MSISFRSIFLIVLMIGIGRDAVAETCTSRALAELRRTAPQGFAVYARLSDKSQFTHWIRCDEAQMGLPTAVHESVHMLSHQLGGYVTMAGEVLPRVEQTRSLFPPRLLAGRFDPRSPFVETYLKPGAATSADEFGYLLDELNAYAHDLDIAVSLAHLTDADRYVFHRDGLAALMAFTAGYVEHARSEGKETWRRLAAPDVRPVVAKLWAQAETVMGRSCRTANFGLEATAYLAPVCAATIRHGLGELLGRPPLCPVSCVQTRHAARPVRLR